MRETELKAILSDSDELPDLSGAIDGATLGAVEERLIVDTYYDTADLRLARWGCTVRYRQGDGWVVKIPRSSKGLVVDRDELAFGGKPGDPPARVLNLVAPLSRGAAIEEVASLRTRRHARAWANDGAVPVAEMTLDEVAGTATGSDAVCFRELEVELAPDADARLLDGIVERLSSTDDAVPDPVPKLVRVLGSAATEPADVVPSKLPAKPTAAEVIEAALSKSVVRLLLHLPVARLGTDPEGVHQARVACRRLRSDLQTFESLVDAEWAAALRVELRFLIDDLGLIRDSDVLGARLLAAIDSDPEIDREAGLMIVGRLHDQRKRDRQRLLRRLGNERTMTLLDDLVVAANAPATLPRAARPAKKVMPKLVRKPWRHLHRAVERLGDDPSPAELHRIRILSKRVRYASEAVAPATGKRAARFARDAADIQDALGELNDAAVARAWLRSTAGELDGPTAFVAGQLAQQLANDAGPNLERWRSAYRSMTRRADWLS
jgi:CHAD domain-containing protein